MARAEFSYRSTQEGGSLLADICRAIAAHRNLSDLFDVLADSLHSMVNFDYLSVVLHDRSRDVMRMHVVKSTRPSPMREGMEFSMDESLAAFVMRQATPTILSDTE
jgi:transcriptional regulator with GAF, ATPase, and Fis domain